jgi:hypothetical protein
MIKTLGIGFDPWSVRMEKYLLEKVNLINRSQLP